MIYQIRHDLNDKLLFSNAYPFELVEILDPQTFDAIISTINNSIKSVKYPDGCKFVNVVCLISIVILVILSIVIPSFSLQWAFMPTFPILVTVFLGYAWQREQLHKAKHAALVEVNNHLIGHQPPLSVDLYYAPASRSFATAVGLSAHVADRYEELSYDCSMTADHRSLFIETIVRVPGKFVVVIPIEKSSRIACDGRPRTYYSTRFPVSLSPFMSPEEYSAMLDHLHKTMHSVKLRRSIMLCSLLFCALGFTLVMLLNRATIITGCVMLGVGGALAVYELRHHHNTTIQECENARELINVHLSSRTPPMHLAPCIPPILDHKKLDPEFSDELPVPLTLIVGYEEPINVSVNAGQAHVSASAGAMPADVTESLHTPLL